jgi:hypothetical protein
MKRKRITCPRTGHAELSLGVAIALTTLALVACTAGSSAPVRPGLRGPRVDEHLDAAREHERRAQQLALWPETRPDGSGSVDDPHSGLWYRRWDTARDEARAAEHHRNAAAALQAQYEEACGSAPLEEVEISPLVRNVIGGTNLDDGVLLYLRPETISPAALLHQIHCHRAWMMLGVRGMEDCPLDLASIQIVAHGDPNGASIEITARDPALVSELQRRAAKELELAVAQSRREGREH